MPVEKFKLTVLVENNTSSDTLAAEHGLSFFIEADESRVLFDVGATDAVVKNADALRIDFYQLNAVVLSHGHYDHAGGLGPVLDRTGGVDVFAHPAAFEGKYVREEGKDDRFAGAKTDLEAVSRKGGRFYPVEKPEEIAPDVFLTGSVPRKNDYETISPRFQVKKNGGWVHDDFPDDMACFVKTSDGVVIIAGCAHAGIINTIEHVQQLTGGEKINAVIGGFHLVGASQKRIRKTVEEFSRINPSLIGPVHCTGNTAFNEFKKAFGERVIQCPSGRVVMKTGKEWQVQ